MEKLSDTERKHALKKLRLHMNNIEQSIFGIISVLSNCRRDQEQNKLDLSEQRRILKLKQLLLSLRVEYNIIKLRYNHDH
jgi:hypothetical protein